MRTASERSRWRAAGAAAVFVGAVVVAQVAGPARSQQPPPTGPQVESARLVPAQPVAGRPVVLIVRARDPALPIRGMRVDFGERGSRAGGSACRIDQRTPSQPFRPGPAVTLRARYRFRAPGPRTVAFTVTSGGCAGAGLRFSGSLAVTVAPRGQAPSTPAPAPPPTVTPPATAAQGALCSHADTPSTQIDGRTVRAATLCLINAERQRRAAQRLRVSDKLRRAASAHTQDMVRRSYFEHEGPGGPSFVRRLDRVGYRGRAGENIAYETGPDVTARSIFRGWMDSPPHKSNMLRRAFRGAGIGTSDRAPVRPPERGSTFTADFGSSRG